MRDIEDAFSVISPGICGHGQFVDKKFNPICPTAHVLRYNGENLEKIFKRKGENIVRKLAFMLGVLPEALYEFIAAWDYMLDEGMEKKLAFDRSLTAAEKVEEAYEKRQEELRRLRIKANHPPYVNFLEKVKTPEGVNLHLGSPVVEFDVENGFVFKEFFKDTDDHKIS